MGSYCTSKSVLWECNISLFGYHSQHECFHIGMGFWRQHLKPSFSSSDANIIVQTFIWEQENIYMYKQLRSLQLLFLIASPLPPPGWLFSLDVKYISHCFLGCHQNVGSTNEIGECWILHLPYFFGHMNGTEQTRTRRALWARYPWKLRVNSTTINTQLFLADHWCPSMVVQTL